MSECPWHPTPPDQPPVEGPCPDCEAARDEWEDSRYDRERER